MDSGNKVIIIGKNHHHILAMARVFGVNGIKPYGIFVGMFSVMGFARRSKYWRKVWSAKNNAQVIDILRREFQNETQKPVVIPCSDAAAIELDNHLDELRQKYILGSFNHEQGRIPQLMDKFSQVEFVKNNLGLNMAESFIINLSDGEIPAGLPFPCIVKPVVSAEGNKGDIRKFDDIESLREYLGVLKAKGYERILAQKFLDIDYEFCLSGCCGEIISYFVSKTVRAWPIVGGTGCWDKIMNETEIHELCINILKKLSYEGYSGLIDIEFFKVGEKIYLSEINWRNSARVFMCTGTKIFYPLIWYWSVTEQSEKIQNIPLTTKDTSLYGMDERNDIAHVINLGLNSGRLSLREWVRDVKRSCSFSAWYRDDKLPAFWSYPSALFLSLIPLGAKEFIKKLLKWK